MYLFYSGVGPEYGVGLTRLNYGVCRNAFFSAVSKGELISCLFRLLTVFSSYIYRTEVLLFLQLLTKGCSQLLEAIMFLGLWLLSSIFKYRNGRSSLSHACISLASLSNLGSFWYTPMPSSSIFYFKDPIDKIRPIQIIQDNLPISRSITLIALAKFVLLCKVTSSQVLEIRPWTSLGDHYSVQNKMPRESLEEEENSK